MSFDRDAEWARFDQLGEDEVRKRLGAHQYAELRQWLAEAWLEHQESNRASEDRAKTLEEVRAANSLAREATDLARSANSLAEAANTAAARAADTEERAAVAAEDAAKSAKRAASAAEDSAGSARRQAETNDSTRRIAMAALAIAIVSGIASFIDWLMRK